MDKVIEHRDSWGKMETSYGQRDHHQSEGIMINMINQKLSAKEIRVVVPVGGYRCDRFKRAVDSGFVNFHTSVQRRTNFVAITSDQLRFMKNDATKWETEEGFPCAHRRPCQYIIEENMTWTKLHSRYVQKAEQAGVRVISLTRWTQTIHCHYPGLRLTRSKEDVCDACVQIETQILSPDISNELRAKLVLEKSMHIQAAIDQQHAMTDFVKQFVAKIDLAQKLPNEILQDCIDTWKHTLEKIVSTDLNVAPIPTVLIQAEDFDGSLALPHYGFNRPSADYFNSNLVLHQFFTTNITDDTNRVIFYDERGQGKGADALCSLKIRNYLELLDGYRARGSEVPSCMINILDNCVGQNKSNSVMKFFAMVSLLLFQKVVLLYLLPEHSHRKADRVVAWCKGRLRWRNIYHPIGIAVASNSVKGVFVEFLGHRETKLPFFAGWDNILDKYFKQMPTSFTSYYYYDLSRDFPNRGRIVRCDPVCMPTRPTY